MKYNLHKRNEVDSLVTLPLYAKYLRRARPPISGIQRISTLGLKAKQRYAKRVLREWRKVRARVPKYYQYHQRCVVN